VTEEASLPRNHRQVSLLERILGNGFELYQISWEKAGAHAVGNNPEAHSSLLD